MPKKPKLEPPCEQTKLQGVTVGPGQPELVGEGTPMKAAQARPTDGERGHGPGQEQQWEEEQKHGKDQEQARQLVGAFTAPRPIVFSPTESQVSTSPLLLSIEESTMVVSVSVVVSKEVSISMESSSWLGECFLVDSEEPAESRSQWPAR